MRAPAKGTAFFLALLLLPVPAAAEGLALYKAVYALKLVAAAPGSAVTGAGGEMYYEQDDACDGWTTEQRLATRYDYAGGRSALDTARYAAFESKDGGDFSFNAEQEENGREDMHISGSVARGKNGAATALYTRPDGARRALPAGYFLPMAHTRALLRHAEAGDRFFDAVLFDGTDEAGPVEASAFIGEKETAVERKETAGKYIDAKLLAPDAWHVRLAVFPLNDRWKSTPAYELAMILHANGVVSHAVVHYKNFAVEQRLIALQPLPASRCR